MEFIRANDLYLLLHLSIGKGQLFFDAMRLLHDARLSNEVRRRLFYLPIEPEFLSWEEGEAFDNLLLGDVPEKAGSGLLF